MATITRIIETEQDNYDRIHLFREGLFFKAHQHSAFMFNTQIKNFRTVKKHYKAAGCDVVMLGFPSRLLDGLFPDEGAIEVIDEGHICISCSPLDRETYRQWFDSIELAPEKRRIQKQKDETVDDFLNFDAPEAGKLDDTGYNVLRELELFDVGNATPVECMLFIGRLKSELKGRVSGGI